MFSRRKTELEFYQKAIEQMEASKKSQELMVSAISQMMESKFAVTDKKEEIRTEVSDDWSDEQKRQAAYALNLCTVSVSQIIDYNDENILEQEYETILNNLNLENMPKDEALLNILKQILDTVTFFRIQEGDKALIEKEYLQKMKNAIWSSVPNFGVIIATGNPFAMAASLASQVGIGYMNYRKQKAEIGLAKEKSEWQLQRAAMEQLNALRRELFDASWRLADRYGFSDEYRLTEKQIAQYDKILMDPDDYKRFERLDAVKTKFIAYPAFWYHFGHAANCIAQAAHFGDDLDEAVYASYRKKAIDCFEYFMNSDKHSLLRDDPITSSCALEYIDLLGDSEEDKRKIKELLARAIGSCGGGCDVIQLCAIAYLKIGDFEEASGLLKYLVNEDYNAQMNAQILSGLYVRELMAGGNEERKAEYRILEKKKNININWLFPMPSEGDNMDQLTAKFTNMQRERLAVKFEYVMERYCEKCEAQYNKCVPVPVEGLEYEEAFFSNVGNYHSDRLALYENCLRNEHKREDFLTRLTESHFTLEYINVLNGMLNGFDRLWPIDINEQSDSANSIVDIVRVRIETSKDSLNRMQNGITSNYDVWQLLADIDKYDFKFFAGEAIRTYYQAVSEEIKKITDMAGFTKCDGLLNDFCKSEGIEEYREMTRDEEGYEAFSGDASYLSYDLLGGDAQQRADYLTRLQAMVKHLENRKPEIVGNGSEKYLFIREKGNGQNTDFFKFFQKHRVEWYQNRRENRQDTFAVMQSSSFTVPDIAFTSSGIRVIWFVNGWMKDSDIVKYEDVRLQDNKLIIGKDKFWNKNANMDKLFELIQDYAEKYGETKMQERNNAQIEGQGYYFDAFRQIEAGGSGTDDDIITTYDEV